MKSCGICPFPSAFVSLSLLTSRSIHVVTDGKISSSFYGWVADWVTSLSLFTFMHWRRKWQPAPAFLPGESQGRESLAGCRLWGCRVGHNWVGHKVGHFSLSCIGEGNGNPLQCPCLENLREPGGLPSMGSHRVGQDWSDLANTILSMSPTSASTSQERSLLQPC